MDNYFQQLKLYFQLKYIYVFDTKKKKFIMVCLIRKNF